MQHPVKQIPDLLGFLGSVSVPLALSAFLLRGSIWNTGYQDWISHAFRSESLQLHGLVSWDHIWNNGISYWSAYQFIPHLLTVGLGSLPHVGVVRAMMILGVAIFVGIRAGIYIGLRMLGCKPFTAFCLSICTLNYLGFWQETEDYSVTFGALLIPVLLTLWWKGFDSYRCRMLFAASIGLAVYVHPLSAVSLGGLWLLTLPWAIKSYGKWQPITEGFLIASMSFFYTYGLIASDIHYSAPYQMTHAFTQLIGGNTVRTGVATFALAALAWFSYFFRSRHVPVQSKLLLWYASALFLTIMLSYETNVLDSANKIQIVRATFFVVIAIPFVVFPIVEHLFGRWRSLVSLAAVSLALSLIVAGSFIDTMAHAPSTTVSLPDPVSQFMNKSGKKPQGRVYIVDSIVSSYNHPELRYVNGYNDQLLPQLTATRLTMLLTVPTPDYRIPDDRISRVDSYVRLLGVQYLFISINSPFVDALTERPSTPYVKVDAEPSLNGDVVVLEAPWDLSNAAMIDSSTALSLTSNGDANRVATSKGSWEALDRAVGKADAAERFSDRNAVVRVEYPSPDRMIIKIPQASKLPSVYIAESFSKAWRVENGPVKINKTDEGMIELITNGTTEIKLRHSWHNAGTVQAVLIISAGLFMLWTLLKKRPTGNFSPNE